MDVRRRTAIKIGGAAALFAGAQPAAAAVNPLAEFIAPDGGSIKVVQLLAKNDGGTRIAEGERVADKSPYPLFQQFLTHDASAIAIYAAPPHHKIAADGNAGKSLLFIVAGETTLKAGGTTRRCPAGTVILSDAGIGADLKETAGPAGYTAIKVMLAD